MLRPSCAGLATRSFHTVAQIHDLTAHRLIDGASGASDGVAHPIRDVRASAAALRAAQPRR